MDGLFHQLHQVLGRVRIESAQGFESQPQTLDRFAAGALNPLDLIPLIKSITYGNSLFGGIGGYPFQGGLTDPSGWAVDDAHQGLLIVRIHQQSQVGHHVAHFLAVEETHPAHEGVGNVPQAQFGFKGARLDCGTEEDREFVEGMACFDHFVNELHDLVCFHFLVAHGDQADRFTFSHGRTQCLFVAARVVLDQAVGAAQDRLGGAIVGFQGDHLGAAKGLFEGQDLGHVGSAPGVDALIVIAHHAEVPVFSSDRLHDFKLGTVRVLILVHQYKAMLVGDLLPQLGVAQQAPGFQQEVIEVQLAGALQGFLVLFPGARG